MISFAIKSTITLFVIYILYKVFFARENIPVFKRFFLLAGIVFSAIMPFVSINTATIIPETLNNIIAIYTIREINPPDTEIIVPHINRYPYMEWLLYGIYMLVAGTLLFRYTINIKRLQDLKRNNQNYSYKGYKVVVLEQDQSPFSFLKTLFIGNKNYNNGMIRKEILAHELAHIRQLHTLDILLIELIQAICWFNPLIWLYKKEIRLNHEYLADTQAIAQGIEIHDYQYFILNFTFRNNSSYLASNFNYSPIKKRFIMLAKEKSLVRTSFKTLASLTLIALLTIFISGQEVSAAKVQDNQVEWWEPILKKHNLEVKKVYNNFENVFETAESNSINNGISTSTNATLIIRVKEDKTYFIMEACHAEHNLKSGMIRIIPLETGTIKLYDADDKHIGTLQANELTICPKEPASKISF